MGGWLVALPRRFRGRFLTIKRWFVETVVTLLWCGSVVDASWMVSWHCRGRGAGRLAMTVSSCRWTPPRCAAAWKSEHEHQEAFTGQPLACKGV